MEEPLINSFSSRIPDSVQKHETTTRYTSRVWTFEMRTVQSLYADVESLYAELNIRCFTYLELPEDAQINVQQNLLRCSARSFHSVVR